MPIGSDKLSCRCSIVCVSYNHAKFAAAGLESLYDQTYRNIEIIILDDGSSDETVKLIEAALAKSQFSSKIHQAEKLRECSKELQYRT